MFALFSYISSFAPVKEIYQKLSPTLIKSSVKYLVSGDKNNLLLYCCSISIVLYTAGYFLHGMGYMLNPISDIVDELHDSDSSSDSSDLNDSSSDLDLS